MNFLIFSKNFLHLYYVSLNIENLKLKIKIIKY